MWYRTENGHGTFHVNYGRKKPGPAPCRAPRLDTDDARLGWKCSRISVALCDAAAGTTFDHQAATCDMPICQHHRTPGGTNIDYCPRHQHLAPAALPLGE